MRRWLAGIALASWLMGPVFGYGTTVSIAVSYCPATYPSSSGTSSSPSATPTSGPGIPYVLFLALSGQPEYIADEGTISTDPREAVTFTITPSGQLMSGGNYVSTTGDVPSQPFEVSPLPMLMKRLGLITTVFSLTGNNTLIWRNDAFVGHEAVFCVFGSILEIVFDGIPPPGCIVVELGAIPAEDVTLPPISSSTTLSRSQSTDVTPSGASTETTLLSSGPESTTSLTSTLLPSLVPSSETTFISPSSDFASGGPTAPLNTATSSALTTAAPVSGFLSSSSHAEPSSAQLSTSSGYPAPTTTGTPNCFDRSPFDGTVNDNYLILCDTELPGYELDAVPASDISQCIEACNSYVPTSAGPCVAVEFDILSDVNPCKLKFNISVVDRGANAFSQAAIVVNTPYSPPIVFSDTGLSSSDTTEVESSTSMPTMEMSSAEISTTTTTPTLSSMSPPSNPNSPVGSMTTTGPQNSPPPPPPLTTTNGQQSGVSTTTHLSSSSPSSLVSTTTTTQSAQQPSSPVSTSRSSSSPAPSSLTSSPSGPTPSSATGSAPSLGLSSVASSSPTSVLSSTTPASSPSSALPSTFPVAIPTSSTPATSTVPALSTSTTSRSTTPLATSSLAQSSAGQSTTTTTPTITTTTTSFLATTTTPSYCSATPATTNLCPAYNHQGLNVNSDGVCYEVECTTMLQGAILTGNSTTASSLKACTGFCTLYNVALPYGCVGVNYLGASVGSSSNCILLSSVTGTALYTGVDSGRLLYPGYPSINDPVFSAPTTTTTAPQVSGSVSVSGSTTVSPVTTTTTTTTTPYSASSCPAGPTASACPGTSPTCYTYSNYGNPTNFEIECGTSFQGSALQPLLVFSLEDCISWCQYSNVLTANSCVGLTYQQGSVGQGTTNNCFRYGSLTCASRGNATFDSARMLYAAYPQMTDYGNNPSFLC